MLENWQDVLTDLSRFKIKCHGDYLRSKKYCYKNQTVEIEIIKSFFFACSFNIVNLPIKGHGIS